MAKPYNNSESKKSQVRTMFNNIAPHYDLLNHTLSFNIDRLWRKRVVKIVKKAHPKKVLDLATGTGDLAIMMAHKIEDCHVVGVDLSEGMLQVAREKTKVEGLEERVSLQVGDAEHLTLEDGEVDVATVAFGVRNFGDLQVGLNELARVIRKGGKVVILEFSRPKNKAFRALYEFYSYKILPRIGGLISHDKKAYEYLPESVGEFPKPKAFMEMMNKAGFAKCKAKSQSFGIAQIYIGER